MPPGGPALVSTAALPQFNHFNGQRSRVWPLWLDRDGAEANLADDVLPLLEDEIGVAVSAPDLIAYVTAVVAHPGYGARFARELSSGVVRVPVTTDAEVLVRGTALGHEVLRLQTLGEHRPPALRHRPPGPLLPADAPVRPRLEAPLSHLPGNRPDTAIYDPSDGTLTIGDGVVTDITLDVWDYEVGGMPVIEQWLAQRLTPGARRRQSRLDLITVDAWEAGVDGRAAARPVRPHRAAQHGGGAAGAAGRGAAGAAPGARRRRRAPPLGPQRLLTVRSAARPARRWRPAPGRP